MTTATVAQFVTLLEEQEGVPYLFGGIWLKGQAGPYPGSPGGGVDCSGLPYAACAKLGIGIPRTSEEQFAGLEVVERADVRQGDLVFYDVASDTQPQPAHEGIVWALGAGSAGTILEAPHTGDVVRFAALELYPIMGFRRLPFDPSPPSPDPQPQQEEHMTAVVTPDGKVIVYAASPAGHLLEFHRDPAEPTSPGSVIDVTDLIGTEPTAYLVAP